MAAQNGNLPKVLKVAQVIGSPWGGVMSCVVNYYRNIDRSLVQFDFFTYEKSPYDDEIRALGGNVYTFPNVFKFWKSVPTLRKLFQMGNYDIVHAHMTTRSGFVLKAAKQANVPVRICHAHSTAHVSEGISFFAKALLKGHAVRYATHLAGCGKKSNLWLYGKKRGWQAFVLNNAIDLERFSPQQAPSSETVGFVGRFVFQKNLPFLVKSFAQLLKIRPQAKLVLVGGGKQEKKLKKMSQRLCRGQVQFVSETDDVVQYYHSFNLFVLPSRFEGLPLVAVEAQACGLKCLLSDEISREVDLGGDVRFLPAKNPKAWAVAMDEKLSQTSNKVANLREVGYDITTEAPKLLAYYQKAVGQR